MKKKWSILLTANLLSALVSPLMVHAVTPTTESEEILKNISQSSQTYASESIEQSDMIKQAIKNIQETYNTQTESETMSETEADSTTDATDMELSEESTKETDSDNSNKNELNLAQQKNSADNKIAARSASFALNSKSAISTGKWGTVSWSFDNGSGVLTFTSSGKLGKWNSSPWNKEDIEGNKLTNIIFEKNVIAPSDSSYLFSGIVSGENNLSNLVTIKGLDKIDVSNVTQMQYMFQHLIKIQKLDLSSWDVSEVDDMEGMFESSFLESPDYVKELNISSFNITDSHPNNKQRMFYSTHFNKITVGEKFDLEGELGFYEFPMGDWYNESTGKEIGSSFTTGKGNPFLEYLANGHAGTYTMYPPENPPKLPEEVLKWGTVPYKFDESTGVLTFTDSGTFNVADYSPWNRSDSHRINGTQIKKIVFTKPVYAPKDSKGLFSNLDTKTELLSNLESIEHLDYLNTSNVTKMDSFFSGLYTIKTLDLSKFDTRNVTDMNGMFYKTKSIASLNLDYPLFDTSKVTKMSDMFMGMSSLTTLKMPNLNTSKVTNFTRMFRDVSSMTNLDLSQFRTSSATSMYQMFYGMKNLKTINVTSFDTSKVNSMSGMFNDDSSLTKLDIKNFDTHNVTKMDSMFNGTSSLTELDVTNFKTDKAVNMYGMFSGMSGLKEINVSNFNTSNTENMKSMFAGMTNLTSLNLGSFDFTKVTTVVTNGNEESAKKDMFNNDNLLKEITLPKTFSDPDNETKLTGVPTNDIYNGNWVNIDDKSKKLGQTKVFLKATANKAGTYVWGEKAEDMLRWGTVPYQFDESTGVLTFTDSGTFDEADKSPWNRSDGKGIDATKIKKIVFTKSVNAPAYSKDLFSRFSAKKPYLSNVTSIERLDYLNTSNVTSMDSFFSGLSSIKTLDLSKFDTRNVTDMNGMFFQNKSIESLNLNYALFNTSNVAKMSDMFRGMSSLSKLDITKFNTSKVTTFSDMFKDLSSMTSLDVSSFNTSNANNMYEMFEGMTSLTSLNLGSFDFTKVTDKSKMFAEDTLKEITLPKTFSDPNNTTNLIEVPTTDGYNGQWQNSEGKLFGQTDKFLANYNGEKDAGTYTWGKYLTWGDVPYEFNEDTGVLTFYKEGQNVLGEYNVSPWNRTDGNQIDAKKIKEIVFTEEVNAPENSYALFSDPTKSRNKLTNLEWIKGIEKLDTSKTVNMKHMFDGMSSLKELDLSHFMTGKVTKMNGMFLNVSSLQKLILSNFVTDNVEDTSNMFNGMSSLKELDLSSFDTSKVTNMASMFQKMTRLEKLNISSFDTRNVTNMSRMFDDIRNLDTLDISSFDTQNVTNMSQMFNNVQGTKNLIFNKDTFITSKVTSMFYMFNNMYELNTLDVSNFDTSKVTSMERMFRENRLLERIDVSKFNTSKVTTMESMFEGMDKLSSLNLGSFDFTKVTNKSKMFGNESKKAPIKEITLPTTFSDPENDTKLTDVETTNGYNGNWVNIDNKNVNLGQTSDFLKNTAGKAGTYIWGRQSALHLVKVPDLYDFGNKNSVRDITQILKPQSTGKQEVEIRDDREQKDIWSLSVQASKLESDKLDDLNQARYQFNVTSASDTNVPIQGMTYADKQIVLPADNSSHVLYSMTDKNQSPTSYNTWIDDMKLIVSQNSGKPNEQYSGTITWSLDLTPQD